MHILIRNDKDWQSVRKFIKDNPTYLMLNDDINELGDNGKFLYESYPNHRFEFSVPTSEIKLLLLSTAESFFNKLIPQISFKKLP